MNSKLAVYIIIAAVFLGGVYSFVHFRNPGADSSRDKKSENNHAPCLSENEKVEFTLDPKYPKEIQVATIPVTVFIKNSETGNTLFSFTIDNNSNLLRIRKCGIYLVREFVKDIRNRTEELWNYNYKGEGRKIMTLKTFKEGIVVENDFNSAFTLDPNEKYIGLERSYLGQDNYGYVVKDVNTLETVYELTLNEILKRESNIKPGIVGFGYWSNDSKYVWGPVFSGALDTGFVWMDVQNKTFEAYPPPSDLGDGVEMAHGFHRYIAYADFPSFFGFDFSEQYHKEQFRKESRTKHLYLYNLRTKEKKLLAETKDPDWQFKLKWITDTELEYRLPTGERRTISITP